MATKNKIVVSKDGPYVVSAGVPLDIAIIEPNEEGLSWNLKKAKTFPARGSYELCRCGKSKTKPFCDGSHARTHFDGTETATRRPYLRQAELFDGKTMVLGDAENLCAFARFCDPGGKIWGLMDRTDDPETRKLAIREENHCISGRLVLWDKKTRERFEPKLNPAISVIEDPAMGCSGPLYVQGGITLESEDGIPYEIRNRMTLCRCGASANKPFCNGSHASIRFRDGLVEFVRLKGQ